ncbi:MAG: [Oscillospiraceae bacterium]|nr:[FeFe] hydrogenase H-cluster maturation GTPase HydF [Oscillospiraceae bacterium]
MSLNDTPSSERLHIAFFGRRNAGKSSVVNAVTGQPLSVVSDVRGTTTDPVYKAMELLPLGPVMIVDTAGIDDEGELGQLRVEKSLAVLAKTDIAVLVVDGTDGLADADRMLLAEFEKRKLPYIIAYNKSDLGTAALTGSIHEIAVSALTGDRIPALRELIASQIAPDAARSPLLSDLVEAGDLLVLVIPIDESAPKGRLILPQQQVIRAALEAGAVPVCCKDTELAQTLQKLPDPRLVITDSQAFGKVAPIVPEEIPLTSFSILFARYKGDLATVVRGAAALDHLRDGDKVLLSEGCTHHRQCNDIGTV